MAGGLGSEIGETILRAEGGMAIKSKIMINAARLTLVIIFANGLFLGVLILIAVQSVFPADSLENFHVKPGYQSLAGVRIIRDHNLVATRVDRKRLRQDFALRIVPRLHKGRERDVL